MLHANTAFWLQQCNRRFQQRLNPGRFEQTFGGFLNRGPVRHFGEPDGLTQFGTVEQQLQDAAIILLLMGFEDQAGEELPVGELLRRKAMRVRRNHPPRRFMCDEQHLLRRLAGGGHPASCSIGGNPALPNKRRTRNVFYRATYGRYRTTATGRFSMPH